MVLDLPTRVPFLGRLELIESWLPDDAERILEVGCAWGYLVASLKYSASERYGLDIKLDDIGDAQRLFGHRVRYFCSLAEALPFPDGIFDALIMSEVLEHVLNEASALSEAARVLQPRGVLVLTVPHRGPMELTDLTNWKCRLPRLHRWAYGLKHRGNFARFAPVTQYHRHYTLGQLRALVASHFEITAVQRRGFLLFALADYAALFRNPALVSLLWRIASADYRISYGCLSYNIALRMQKRAT